MRRTSIIKMVVAILGAGFAVAVQHDTFLRRWCLPTPPIPPQSHGVRRSIVTDFDLNGITGRQAIDRLEDRYKVTIGIARATDWPELDKKLSGCVRTATVEQLLWRICGTLAEVEGNTEWTETPKEIVLCYGRAKDERLAVRAYNVSKSDKRLAAIKMAVPDWAIQFLRSNLNAGNDPNDEAAKRMTALTVHGHGMIVSEGLDNPVRANPVVRFGDHVLVLGKERTHWVIAELLRE